jgi:hypothetical protein
MRRSRLCGLAAGAILLLTFCGPGRSWAQHTFGDALSRVSVIPDSQGAIAEILLHYDPDVSIELDPLYNDLLTALPRDVRIKVLCPSAGAVDDFIQSWECLLDGRSVDVINVGLPLSIWARDRCIARQSLDLRTMGATFVPVDRWEYEPEKTNDLLLQDILYEARLAPAVMDSPLHVEGGNIVSNGRHVFFGANVFFDNAGLPESQLAAELEWLLGRPYLSVGDELGKVPWSHVDMYLTPVGEDTVLVASPRLAYSLLSLDDDCGEDAEECDGFQNGVCPSDAWQEQFDAVAALMRENGYRVYRVPAIANVLDQWMITYNNVLMDQRDGQRIVYMPVYGVPSLDRAASAIYRGLGLEVRTVDVSAVFERGGALRCIVNVTRRAWASHIPKEATSGRRVRLINLGETHSFEGIVDRCRHRLAGRRRSTAWPEGALP